MLKKTSLFLFSVLFFSFAAKADSFVLSPKKPTVKTDKLVFTFSEEMVGLGRTGRDADDIPVVFSPDVSCQWRWLDQKNLACFLNKEKPLSADTVYRVAVGSFKTQAGKKTSPADKEFRTASVSINVAESSFERFANPRRPVWQVVFSNDVVPDEQRAFFDFDGTDAIVTAKKCPSWEDNCAAKVFVEAAQDLTENAPYALSYKGKPVFRGQTLPPIGVEGFRCYNGEEFVVFPVAEKAVCRHGYGMWIKMTDDVPQGEASRFVTRAENTPVVSDLIPVALDSGEHTITVAEGLTDRWGNTLDRPAVLNVVVSDRDTDVKTPYDSAVLEAAEDTDMTGFAQNLTALGIEYKGLTADAAPEGTQDIADLLPDVRNKAYAFDYGIRRMTGGKTGFIAGKFKTEPKKPYLQPFFAVVSPWQVVVKLGYENSLIWVVDLKTGKPVKKADIEISLRKIADPAAVNGVLDKARTDGDGLASFAGLKTLDPKNERTSAWGNTAERLFVTVRKGDDIAVMPVGYEFKNYNGEVTGWNGPEDRLRPAAFGITPQTVYRRGETVDYKIWVRGDDFSRAPVSEYDLAVTDSEGQTVSERKKVSLSPFGTIEGSFTIGEKAPTGDYAVSLTANGVSFTPLTVSVSDFTALPFKAASEIADSRLIGGKETVFRSTAALQSGGAFSAAPVRQTAVLSHVPFEYDGFRFHSPKSVDEVLLDRKAATDANGETSAPVPLPVSEKETGKIVFETRVFGDDGRFASAVKSVPYFAHDALVGVKPESFVVPAGQETKTAVVVVSPDKKTVAGKKTNVDILYNDHKLIREKAAGNAYILRYEQDPVPVAECTLTSADKPVYCPFTPDKAGSYTVRAKTGDSTAEASFYVEGPNYVAWASNDDDALTISGDKKSYAVGDTAVLMIENPFPKARLLLTVERNGVLKTVTKKVKDGTVKIKLKIDKDFFPGVYVSAKLFAPRVEKTKTSDRKAGKPDLGKPAEKTGYLKLPVSDPSKILPLTVSTEKTEYRPRQKAKIRISAPVRKPVEAAVIVLDEAMLSLLPNGIDTFDPIPALSGLKDLDLQTYSLIKQLIGRQNIEKKGANQGGDGGAGFAVRDLFKMVGYWNPSLLLDNNGKAEIEVPLPDNLTRWRVIVIASHINGRIGKAQTSFVVTQPLEMRALLPNHVRAGDVFAPAVSVLNRTEKPLEAVVSLGGIEQKETLVPFERKTVVFPMRTAEKAGELAIMFTAEAGKEKDALLSVLPVLPAQRVETAALYGQIGKKSLSVPLDAPEKSLLTLTLSSSVESAMIQAVQAMKTYPFGCWEQQISRAWTALSAAGEWPDSDAFIKKTLSEAESFQTSNGGMAYFTDIDGLESPYLSAYTSFVFTAMKNKGFDLPRETTKKLGKYLLDIFNGRIKTGAATTVRALSVPFLIENGLIKDSDLDALRREKDKMSVFDKAVLYPYLKTDPAENAEISTGSIFLPEQKGQEYAVLPSEAKSNCAALYALPENAALTRGVLALRGKDGTWRTTHANAFCLAALRRRIDTVENGGSADISVKIGDDVLSETTVAKTPVSVSRRFDKAENTTLSFERKGKGKPYWTAALTYPATATESVNAGFEVSRSFAVEQDGRFVETKTFKRGQIVRVTLTLTVPSFKSFVALSDPMAGVLEPISKGLADDSAFYHADVTHESADFFAESLNEGTYEVFYDAQVTADGEFIAPPARAEEMYQPAVFGSSATDRLTVRP